LSALPSVLLGKGGQTQESNDYAGKQGFSHDEVLYRAPAFNA
jgi:hypothetical protein